MIHELKPLAPALLAFAIACSDDPDPGAPSKPEVSYWQDVAPIVFNRCVKCHQEGGIGPFRLDRYEDAKIYAASAVSAVKAGTMPPYLIKADGSCGTFDEPETLTAAEIATLEKWASIGAPEGDPVSLQVPPLPKLGEAEVFTTPAFLPEIQGGALAQFDEYRCFVVGEPFDRDRFVTGYEVLPGNEDIIHHVIVFNVDPSRAGQGGTNAELMAALDAESPDREGWPCFGFAGEGIQVESSPVNWAPGQGALEYPTGTGVRMRAGTQLVMQVHYNLFDPATRGRCDRTEVKIQLKDRVEREGFFLLPDGFLTTLFFGNPAQLEPGKESVLFTWKSTLRELGIRGSYQLYGIAPHMHQRGRKYELRVGPEGGDACAARIERWDFHWQRQYFYEEPIALDDDTPFTVTCDYDTSDREMPVLPGWGTQNEMCLAVMYLVSAAAP